MSLSAGVLKLDLTWWHLFRRGQFGSIMLPSWAFLGVLILLSEYWILEQSRWWLVDSQKMQSHLSLAETHCSTTSPLNLLHRTLAFTPLLLVSEKGKKLVRLSWELSASSIQSVSQASSRSIQCQRWVIWHERNVVSLSPAIQCSIDLLLNNSQTLMKRERHKSAAVEGGN